jgi:hypothetical protein
VKPPISIQLDDRDAERVRRSHEDAIVDLQGRTVIVPLGEVSLASGVETPVAHGLGRRPEQVIVGPVRNASTVGMVQEIRTGSYDRTQVVVLKASGYGATVLADVSVA